MSVGAGYIRIYLAVYDQEIIGGFGLEEKVEKRKRFTRKNKLTLFAECATPYNRPSPFKFEKRRDPICINHLLDKVLNIFGLLRFPNTAFQFIQVR